MGNTIITEVAIIGGGPAGLTAALYLGRAQIDTLVIDKEVCGGQIISSPLLENVPGFYGPGADLAATMLDELEKYPNVQFIIFSGVESIEYDEGSMFRIQLEDGELILANYVIIATGASPIKLPIPELPNIHYCVTCDGALYQDKVVAVIGGGNSALQYALELTRYCRGVYVCTNESELRGEEILRNKVLQHPNIEVQYNFNTQSFNGQLLTPECGYSIDVDGIFVAIGYRPQTEFIDVPKQRGYFEVDERKRIKDIPRLYAVGDCCIKPFNQVVIAMSDGCVAALDIIQDLDK